MNGMETFILPAIWALLGFVVGVLVGSEVNRLWLRR